MAATAVICLLVAGPELRPVQAPVNDAGQVAMGAPAGAPSGAPSGETIAKDNRLMASIDQALEDDVQPAVPVSQLRNPALRGGQRTRATDGD